jgi:hypothetical protein
MDDDEFATLMSAAELRRMWEALGEREAAKARPKRSTWTPEMRARAAAKAKGEWAERKKGAPPSIRDLARMSGLSRSSVWRLKRISDVLTEAVKEDRMSITLAYRLSELLPSDLQELAATDPARARRLFEWFRVRVALLSAQEE